mgnify:CR=1 FL=1
MIVRYLENLHILNRAVASFNLATQLEYED